MYAASQALQIGEIAFVAPLERGALCDKRIADCGEHFEEIQQREIVRLGVETVLSAFDDVIASGIADQYLWVNQCDEDIADIRVAIALERLQDGLLKEGQRCFAVGIH